MTTGAVCEKTGNATTRIARLFCRWPPVALPSSPSTPCVCANRLTQVFQAVFDSLRKEAPITLPTRFALVCAYLRRFLVGRFFLAFLGLTFLNQS
jgi:hypothetical protein